jgi:predicted GIY-YIG superfamily endonuclease
MNTRIYKWEKRSPEWIKSNPGKGTMYKANPDGSEYTEGSEPKKFIPTAQNPIPFNKVINTDAGVYVVVCEKAKHAYVGQSVNMGTRLRSHKMSIVKSEASTYLKMRNHWRLYGEEAFDYIKHTHMPTSTEEELLQKEAEVMMEYIRAGYILYNGLINVNILADIVSCPKDFQLIIEQTINKLASETDFVNKLKEIL